MATLPQANVTQKSLLNGFEYTYPNIDPNYHIRDWNISSVVQNYAAAYSEQVTDKMFLLDVKQVNKVYQNLENYYIGQPTQKAVVNSELKDSELTAGKNWIYSLRSPNADGSAGSCVRYVYSDGSVDHDDAGSDNLGVRPAFYINLSSVIFKSGTGAVDNPYILGYNGISFDMSNEGVTGTSESGLTANVNINVGNFTAQNLQGKIVVALFDNATNKLINVKISDLTLDTNNSTTKTEAFPINKAQYKIKAFLWDGFSNMQELSEASEKIISP